MSGPCHSVYKGGYWEAGGGDREDEDIQTVFDGVGNDT